MANSGDLPEDGAEPAGWVRIRRRARPRAPRARFTLTLNKSCIVVPPSWRMPSSLPNKLWDLLGAEIYLVALLLNRYFRRDAPARGPGVIARIHPSAAASTVVLDEMNRLTYRPRRALPADCNCWQRARQQAAERAPGEQSDRSCWTDSVRDALRCEPDESVERISSPQQKQEGKISLHKFPPPMSTPRGRSPHRPPFFCGGLFPDEKRQFEGVSARRPLIWRGYLTPRRGR